MSLYQKMVTTTLFPLHEKLKGHNTQSVHKALECSQWLSPPEIASLQIAKLRQFLTRIGVTVPYYQRLFEQLNFDVSTIQSVADLDALLLLDKPAIRANLNEMKARGAGGLKRFQTGGSSGEPLEFYLGKERISHDVAAKRRATRWWGVDIGDPEIVLWGSPIELHAQDRIRLLRDRLLRSKLLPAFEMSRENLDQFIYLIQKRRPKMLFGYPSSLALLAEYANEQQQRVDNLGIQVAFVTAERLYDHQRQTIENTFGCPVANGYGGRDAGFIAHECPEGNMHISAEDIVVEIVDNDGVALPAMESGEIVVTHLSTSEFPFVRYRTGDVGALGSDLCNCGRGLPVLARVEGRTTDFITASDGTILHGLGLIYVVREIPEVNTFRIVQESLHHTRIEVVTKSNDREGLQLHIEKAFQKRLGQDVKITVDFVDVVTQEKSGKHRYVVSKLTPGVTH